MSTSAAATELAGLFDSGYGLALLASFEEERGLRAARETAAKLGLKVITWSPSTGAQPDLAEAGKTLEGFLRALHTLRPSGLVLLLDVDPRAISPLERRFLRELAQQGPLFHQHLLVLSPTAGIPEELVRDAALVTLPPPDAAELDQVLQDCAEGLKVSLPADRRLPVVTAALGLGEEEARRAFRVALRLPGDPTQAVLAEKRRLLRRSAALDCLDPESGLESVGGMDELKRWLRERERSRGEEARAFGLQAPRGLLLLGVQGCGKSLCAKAVASEWRLPLARLELAGVFGGELAPEAAMRQAIAAAEAMAPAVLWVDEIEKGFGGLSSGRDPSLTRLFGWFLTWLAERRTELFVVATANEVEALPPELLRKGRFDETFFVDLPDARSRSEILAIHLRRRRREPEKFDLARLAHSAEHFSGSELEQVVVSGLHRAFAAGHELSQIDLERALHDAVPLYRTYEERIKSLRSWAKDRARNAATDVKLVDYFRGGET